MNHAFAIPIAVLTDSYKACHHLMYPEAEVMSAYGEFRVPYNKCTKDSRFVFYGIRYLLEHYIGVQWTVKDVEQAELFFSTHNAGFTPYPFPKDLFMKFVNENNGYFPVTIQALPEGTVANTHVPVFQITAEGEYARLVTFLETIMTQVWYPTTVATLSRRVKDLIVAAFDLSVDTDHYNLIEAKLHDFGMRGCTSVEQTIIGCCAHLLNFFGTDTLPGAYYAQFNLNNGKPVAQSIPASEHSVMTCGGAAGEKTAIDNLISKFGTGGGVFSVVMDSYDYTAALYDLLPQVQLHHINSGGHIVLRPDSGDPIEAVLMGLDAAHKAFGATKNSKGYWVLHNCSVIQGDGINIDNVEKILAAVHAKGYSAMNVTFGMGGGLLQRVNRDSMSFATKLSCTVTKIQEGKNISDPEGGYESMGHFIRPVMKLPATDSGKISFPGKLRVVRDPNGEGLLVKPDFNVLPLEIRQKEGYKDLNPDQEENILKVVYDKGPVKGLVWDDFDTLKARVEKQWYQTKPLHNPISKELKVEIDKYTKVNRKNSSVGLAPPPAKE